MNTLFTTLVRKQPTTPEEPFVTIDFRTQDRIPVLSDSAIPSLYPQDWTIQDLLSFVNGSGKFLRINSVLEEIEQQCEWITIGLTTEKISSANGVNSPTTGKPMELKCKTEHAIRFKRQKFLINYLYYFCPDSVRWLTTEELDNLNMYQVYQQYAEQNGKKLEDVMPKSTA